jgi:hypothetical protein
MLRPSLNEGGKHCLPIVFHPRANLCVQQTRDTTRAVIGARDVRGELLSHCREWERGWVGFSSDRHPQKTGTTAPKVYFFGNSRAKASFGKQKALSDGGSTLQAFRRLCGEGHEHVQQFSLFGFLRELAYGSSAWEFAVSGFRLCC